MIRSKLLALPSSRGNTIIQVSTTMAISRIMSFKNNVEPRFMNRPIGWLVDEAHRTTGSYRLSIYFYRSLECQPTPRWWGCHQAGGVLGQGGSEGESAVGSKLALTRAPA